jgi:hypothetical protein
MTDFERDPTPFYAHLMRGWGGFANVMERMTQDHHAMTEHFLAEFKQLVARLQAVADAQERMIK